MRLAEIHTERLRRSIAIYAAVAMTAISLVVTGASVGPLALTLREAAYTSLSHIVELRIMAAEEFLSRVTALAQQVTSRTVIRDKLADYHDGRISLDAVRDFTRDKLMDSLNLSSELVGILRLGARGEEVVGVGRSFERSIAILPDPGATRPSLSPPVMIDGQVHIVVAAPILSRSGERLGFDLLLIDAGRLVGILHEGNSLGRTGDMAIIGHEPVYQLLIPFEQGRVLPGGRLSAEDPVTRVAGATRPGQPPVIESSGDPILVSAPVPGTGWTMVMRMSKDEATASVDRLVLAVTLTALALAVAGVIGLLLVLRPLTGGIIVHTQDMRRQIDELERARADLQEKSLQLTRSNADLQEFAYVASHDLQEPLRMISSYAQLLERRYKDRLDDEAREFIGFMVEGVTRMQAIILHLLEFSRVGGKRHALSSFGSRDAVTASMRNLAMAIEESGAEVRLGELPVIHADRQQFTRLMQNLIGNALKYRHPGRPPRIQVEAVRQGSFWRFSVSDNGIGIDPQYFERIFKLFQRLHPRGQYEGTGIGLAICRKIVEVHGGTMGVESSPGQGSTFVFTLPDAMPEATPDRAVA